MTLSRLADGTTGRNAKTSLVAKRDLTTFLHTKVNSSYHEEEDNRMLKSNLTTFSGLGTYCLDQKRTKPEARLVHVCRLQHPEDKRPQGFLQLSSLQFRHADKTCTCKRNGANTASVAQA